MYELFTFVFFASVVCLLGKEIEPKSEIRFGWECLLSIMDKCCMVLIDII